MIMGLLSAACLLLLLCQMATGVRGEVGVSAAGPAVKTADGLGNGSAAAQSLSVVELIVLELRLRISCAPFCSTVLAV